MNCTFCAIKKKHCSSSKCDTREVDANIKGVTVQDLKPLAEFFSSEFLRHCFAAAIVDVKTNTDAKIVHDHHLTGVKRTLRWELNLWLLKPTIGPLSAIMKPPVEACSAIMKFPVEAFESMPLGDGTLGSGIDDVVFTPGEVSYLQGVLPTNEEVEKIAGEKEPTIEEAEKTATEEAEKTATEEAEKTATEEVEKTAKDVEKTATEEAEKSAIEEQIAKENKYKSLNELQIAKEKKYKSLNELFPKMTLNKFLAAAHGELKLENQILDSLVWETEAWKAHPLKGPLALCDDDVVASAFALDRPTKEQLFTELQDDLTWTKEQISNSAVKLSKMEKNLAMLREY